MQTSNITKLYSEPLESPTEQLRSHMRGNGIPAPSVFQWDGQIHRFPTKDGHDDAGWYVLYDDNIPAGAYGDWRTGTHITFVANIGRTLTDGEIQQNRMRLQEIKRINDEARRMKNERASETCQQIWDDAPGADREHPYLKSKGILPHIARIHGDGRLIVPLFNPDGTLSTLQYIDAMGGKLYQLGGATKAKFCTLGEIKKKVFIVEGFATGATVYETTETATVIAYSAGNLEPVAGVVRAQYPTADIVIVADNDANGVGYNHAMQASSKHGCRVIMPPTPGDANDFRQSGGDLFGLLTTDANLIDKMQVVFGDQLSDTYEAPDEVIQGLIVANSMSVIYGDSNSGKTFLALSLAMAVAEGVPCYGRAVDPGLVLYLATEAPGSIRSRMQALKRYHGRSLSNLAMVPVPLNFHSTPGDATSVIHLVEELERIKGKKVRMIIGDTLARMSAGANENSGEDMGPVMERFSMVTAHTGSAVVIIHHNGKDQARGARGWSGIRAHIDTEIEVEDSQGIKSAKVTKQRELGSKGEEILFKLEVIEMGKSKFGAKVTTCVAIPNNDAMAKRWDKTELKRIELLKEIIFFYDGQVSTGYPFVTKEDIKRYLVTQKGMSEDNARKNLQENNKTRFLGALISDGLVRAQDGGFVVLYTEQEG